MEENKDKEITGITVTYTDGSTKELSSGCCVDLADKGEEMSVEMLNIKPVDIVRLAYGMLACVDRMGLMDAFRKFAGGGEDAEE